MRILHFKSIFLSITNVTILSLSFNNPSGDTHPLTQFKTDTKDSEGAFLRPELPSFYYFANAFRSILVSGKAVINY